MATEAARLKRKNPQQGGKRKTDRKRKTDLTLTGLLMEGVTQILEKTSWMGAWYGLSEPSGLR
jgi:hypothetical protein